MNNAIARLAHATFLKAGRVIAFDTETTGLDAKQERIIELAYKMWEDGELKDEKTIRFLPWDYEKDKQVPNSPGAKRVNGINDEDLVGNPKFKELAAELRAIFTDEATYVGYNVEFDLKMIREEFKRCGEKDLQYKNCRIVDPFKLWKNVVNGNKLTDAYMTFVGGELKNAHSALADIDATIEVLFNMADKFRIKMDVDTLSEQCGLGAILKQAQTDGPVESDYFKYDDKKNIVCNFGKHRGKKLSEIDKGYLTWAISKGGFPPDVTKVMGDYLSK